MFRSLSASTRLFKPIKTTVMPSGMKILTEDKPSSPKTAGSRHTARHPQGITQLLKRLAFKGTCTKFPSEVSFLTHIDSLCGELTCDYQRDLALYFGRFYSDKLDEMIQALSDSIYQPLLTEEDIKIQINNIKNELSMQYYSNEYGEQFMQHIMESSFRHNTLGLKDVPSEESFNEFHIDSLQNYLQKYFHPSRMVLAGLNIPHESLVECALKYFEVYHNSSILKPVWGQFNFTEIDDSVSQYTGGLSKYHDPNPRIQPGHVVLPELAYAGIGFEGVPDNSSDIYALAVLYSLFGQGRSFSVGGPGKGMYNRVNLNLMNRYYWLNSAEAFMQAFSDTGIFMFHGSCTPENVNEMLNAILNEYFKVLTDVIDDTELSRAKRQLGSQLLMNLEISYLALEDLGRKAFLKDSGKNWCEILENIEKVTSDDIKKVCENIMRTPVAVPALGNLSKMPSYEAIQESIVSRKPMTTTPRFWF